MRVWVRLAACCLALAAGGQEIESEVGKKRRETEAVWAGREFRDIFTIFCLILFFVFFRIFFSNRYICVCVHTPVNDLLCAT